MPEGWVNVFDVQREAERKLDPGPLGLLTAEDAELAVAHGATGVVVSNHGGIRRGVDVAIALALGADAVLVGRPAIWGLAAAGAEGVEWVLRTLTEELQLALALLGVAGPRDLSHEHLRRALTTRVYSD